MNNDLAKIATDLEELNEKYFFKEKTIGLAGKETTKRIIFNLRSALFPGVYEKYPINESYVNTIIGNRMRTAALDLNELVECALMNFCEDKETHKEIHKEKHKETHKEKCTKCKDKANDTIIKLLNELPYIREILHTDIEAAYNGDPAALSKEEILLSYPSVEAISIHRIAHLLYRLEIPLIPRMMSEIAHQNTGIDIHPGAKIDESFFIDHGTGVVIGETCTIGKNVKIYQGVTLGAKSFPLDENGNPIKGIKRHPDIGDNVVIYAGATILGGDTSIGNNSTIGGNVWLTHSVPPYSTVYTSQPSPIIK